MQNAIAPIAPATATAPPTPVESKPSPRTPPSHAFATMLKLNQSRAAAPVKPTPSKPTQGAAADDGQASPSGKAAWTGTATAADARRPQDAKADGDPIDATRDGESGEASADRSAGASRDGAAATTDGSGNGVPMTHGLVALHRLAAAPVEAAATESRSRAGRAAAASPGKTSDLDEDTATSSHSRAGPGATGSPPIDGRPDEASMPARSGTGAAAPFATALAATAPAGMASTAQGASHAEPTAPGAAAAVAGPAPANPGAPVDATVATPLASADFAQAFAVQVSVLVQDGVQSAELHLNPVETGPVSVQITVDGTQARIEFGADALATRQAIEAGLPQLASALREAGMTLQGGGVSQHARDPGSEPRPGGATASAGALRGDDDARAAPVVRHRTVSAGGVDLYA